MSSASNEYQEIKLLLPLFFLLMTIASIIGIVSNSILLGTSDLQDGGSDFQVDDAEKIIRIVTASLLAMIFLLISIFLFIEIGKPDDYTPRVMTAKVDKKIRVIEKNIESHEILLLVGAYILFPIGVGISLVSGGETALVFAGIFVIIAYYTYVTRTGLRENIRRTLVLQSSMSMDELSRIIGKDKRRVKKQLLYMISFEKFPAKYDFVEDVIQYFGKGEIKVASTQNVTVSSNTQSTVQRQSSATTKFPECDYCGATAPVAAATFCAECGASLMPAK